MPISFCIALGHNNEKLSVLSQKENALNEIVEM